MRSFINYITLNLPSPSLSVVPQVLFVWSKEKGRQNNNESEKAFVKTKEYNDKQIENTKQEDCYRMVKPHTK